MKITPTIVQKLKILLVESNSADRKLIIRSIMECCSNSELKFAENMQDAMTLSSIHYFDFILLESTHANNVNINELKQMYLSRSYMPCIIILSSNGSSHHIDLRYPGAGGSIIKQEVNADTINKCFTSLLNLRIPGVIQQYGKTKLPGVILHQMTNTDHTVKIKIDKKKSIKMTNAKDTNDNRNSKKTVEQGKMVKVKPSFGSLKILIADDNDINRFIIEKMMKNWDVNMTLTADGRETIAKFSQEKFDLVLLDIEMPGMNGYETARAIRKDMKNKDIPIIAMTGHMHTDEKEKCFISGMNDIMCKPFDQQTLRQMIEKWQPSYQQIVKK